MPSTSYTKGERGQMIARLQTEDTPAGDGDSWMPHFFWRALDHYIRRKDGLDPPPYEGHPGGREPPEE